MISLQGRRAVVTGASGMVGSALVGELLRCGCSEVIALVRATSDLMVLRKYSGAVNIIVVDLCDVDAMTKIVHGVDMLFHCAAVVSFEASKSEEIVAVNLAMTRSVCCSAHNAGVGVMVHVSSIATLGDGNPVTEESVLDSIVGRSAYSESKYLCERCVCDMMKEGLRAVVVNPAIIIGEGNWTDGSSRLIAVAAKGMLFYTGGVKGYVDLIDVVVAMVRLSQCEKVLGERFILSAANLSFGELFGMVANAANRRAPMFYISERMINLVSKIERFFRGKSSLLSESIVANAVDRTCYNGDKVKRYIDFEYTPIDETIIRVTKAYLNRENMNSQSCEVFRS